MIRESLKSVGGLYKEVGEWDTLMVVEDISYYWPGVKPAIWNH